MILENIYYNFPIGVAAKKIQKVTDPPYLDLLIHPLKDNRRRAIEKKLVYIVYSCQTGDFGPWARFRHMAGQKN